MRDFGLGLIALMLALTLAGCGPELGSLEKGETSKVAAAANGDTLTLESGLRVFLAEIDAPRGDQPYARQAQAELEALALHREAQLAYGGPQRWTPRPPAPGEIPREPPPETAIAHVFVQSEGGRWLWLQRALVARGAAYVRGGRAHHARLDELLAAEAEARAAERGLWGERAYQVMSPRQAAALAPRLPGNCFDRAAPFGFVEGVIARADVQERRAALVFALPESAKASFSAVVFGAAFRDWSGPALETYAGRTVRVRGPMEAFKFRNAPADEPGRPQICVDHPSQIEMLEAQAPK